MNLKSDEAEDEEDMTSLGLLVLKVKYMFKSFAGLGPECSAPDRTGPCIIIPLSHNSINPSSVMANLDGMLLVAGIRRFLFICEEPCTSIALCVYYLFHE